MKTHEAALHYLQKHWQPVPVPAHSKNPGFPGWESFACTATTSDQYFNGIGNIGLLLGLPSHGLVDVDLDVDEAVQLARIFLPPTNLRSGRMKRPDSHWWYEVDPPDAKLTKFLYTYDTQETTLIEFRATGGQTIVPPSLHPDGDSYVWHEFGEPAKVSAADLLQIVRKIAIGALLARFWPTPGRHNTGLAVGGLFLSCGWEAEDAADLVYYVARVARHTRPDDRRRCVLDTFRNAANGRLVKGIPSLTESMPSVIVDRLVRWCREYAQTPQTNGTRAHARMDAPASPWTRIKDAKVFALEERKEIESIVKDIVFPGVITMITGPKGIGKSLLSTNIAVSSTVTNGTFRGEPARPVRVLYLDRENPEKISQKRLIAFGVLATEHFYVLTREQDPPVLTDHETWARFPVAEYDVIIIDSVGTFTPGVTEKEGKETTLILHTLLDIAARGPASVLLNNTDKTGTNVRGRGEWTNQIDVHYEIRDITGVSLSGKKHWTEEIPSDGAADWQAREARRRGKSTFRLAFFAEKFRIGATPDPFVVELSLTGDRWTLADVTATLEHETEAARTKAQKEKDTKTQQAAEALAVVVRDRAAIDEPLLKTQAEEWLCHEQNLSQKVARALIVDKTEILWRIEKLENARGKPQALFPVGENPEQQKSTPPGTLHESRTKEEDISVTPEKSTDENSLLVEPLQTGTSRDTLFSSVGKSRATEISSQKSPSNGHDGGTLISVVGEFPQREEEEERAAIQAEDAEAEEQDQCPYCDNPVCWESPNGWVCQLPKVNLL